MTSQISEILPLRLKDSNEQTITLPGYARQILHLLAERFLTCWVELIICLVLIHLRVMEGRKHFIVCENSG